ncbi:MAG TPA: acetate/propionate family kinase [Burkholderiales bacterium]|nr:acetate/propionate family kinase [Burkholderiales bacterium]
MTALPSGILVINGGSSSFRFAMYDRDDMVFPRLSGKLDRIGVGKSMLTYQEARQSSQKEMWLEAKDQKTAVGELTRWLDSRDVFGQVRAIGHRIVHGMGHGEPLRLNSNLIEELKRNASYAPDHLPSELEMVEAISERFPHIPQIACFDTAFHANLPQVARMLPLPRRFDAQGIRRYGFHGLSYSFLMEALVEKEGKEAASGRIILAHLGNGASLAAVKGGQCLDTSMGFTPAGGLVMGTRPGDLDPGVLVYLLQHEGVSTDRLNQIINHESGLIGLSGTTSDMRDLIRRQETDSRAKEAIDFFCYQARKWIGAFSAALNGLDILIFSGGIGEHSDPVRARICEGLDYLGIKLDVQRNRSHAEIISSKESKVRVRVMQTDEERMMAGLTNHLVPIEN